MGAGIVTSLLGLVGTGAGIGASFIGGGSGGGKQNVAGFTNPAAGVINNLFGVPTFVNRSTGLIQVGSDFELHGEAGTRGMTARKLLDLELDNGIQPTDIHGNPLPFDEKDKTYNSPEALAGAQARIDAAQAEQFPFATPSFGPDDFENIGDLLDVLPLNDADLFAQGLGSGDEISDAFNIGKKSLNEALGMVLRGSNRIGSFDPFREQALETLGQEREDLAGRFGQFTGTLSSPFADAALEQNRLASVDLAAAEGAFNLDAAQLDSALANSLASIGGVRAAFPTSFGQDALNFGSSLRSLDESQRPGFRQLELMNAIMSLGNGSTFNATVPGFSPTTSGTAANLNALSQQLPALGQNTADLINNFRGSSRANDVSAGSNLPVNDFEAGRGF